jgi:hypothetical protein
MNNVKRNQRAKQKAKECNMQRAGSNHRLKLKRLEGTK